jgi:hypothetical protein
MTDTPRQDRPSPRPSPSRGEGGKKKDLRAIKLGRLFSEAKKRGIDADQLRNEIAPGQIGKRLSKASAVEIETLTRYIGAAPSPTSPSRGEATAERPRMSGFKERYDELGFRDGFASPGQLRMIEAMWMGVSRMPNRAAKERALQGFLKRIAGVEDMRFIEGWMVQKVVKAIRAMQEPKAATKAPRHEEKQKNKTPF